MVYNFSRTASGGSERLAASSNPGSRVSWLLLWIVLAPSGLCLNRVIAAESWINLSLLHVVAGRMGRSIHHCILYFSRRSERNWLKTQLCRPFGKHSRRRDASRRKRKLKLFLLPHACSYFARRAKNASRREIGPLSDEQAISWQIFSRRSRGKAVF